MDVIIGAAATEVSTTRNQIPEIQKVKLEAFNVSFTGSTSSKEKRQVIRDLLETFRYLFVETLMTPGRTDLLEFLSTPERIR
ncbi:hypothetical protein PI125_g11617 [Phytophthora idaei]|nr:hypothetical protein PI125_g11617 [Phytophthora idaei]KAG3140294.1 hypothetical protein PI126_g16080 [Phytophthora idaei]